MNIWKTENAELVTHLVPLVMPDLDPLPENVPSVMILTDVLTDNSVAHLWEDVSMPKLSVTETMSTKPDTKIVTLVTTHSS
jgi:hypothetical protein